MGENSEDIEKTRTIIVKCTQKNGDIYVLERESDIIASRSAMTCSHEASLKDSEGELNGRANKA